MYCRIPAGFTWLQSKGKHISIKMTRTELAWTDALCVILLIISFVSFTFKSSMQIDPGHRFSLLSIHVNPSDGGGQLGPLTLLPLLVGSTMTVRLRVEYGPVLSASGKSPQVCCGLFSKSSIWSCGAVLKHSQPVVQIQGPYVSSGWDSEVTPGLVKVEHF